MSAGAAFFDRLVAELERQAQLVPLRASAPRLVREVERAGFWARAWRYLNEGLRSRAHVPRLLPVISLSSHELERLALERDNPGLTFRES